MADTKTKKNPDFTASAESITNTDEVRTALLLYYQLRVEEEQLLELVKGTELYKEYLKIQRKGAKQIEKLHKVIDEFGGYQDVETGNYALRQRRFTTVFIPEMVKQHLPPDLVSAVLAIVVDIKRIEQFVKGGVITPEQVGEISVRKEIEPHYIIK